MKPRVTAAEVAAHPGWAAALYLQGLPVPALREQGRLRLAASGLRHTALETDVDVYTRAATPSTKGTPWTSSL